MELPNLGENCQEQSCKTLDFLPFKCDCCGKVFCKDHYGYSKHNCTKSQEKNFQIPICPLCNNPVPFKRGELPDILMSAHIDRDCKSDPAEERRRKIFKNKCSLKGCKQKEIIQFECSSCKQNFCVRHRLEIDHECSKPPLDSNRLNDLNKKRLDFFQKNKTNTHSSASNNATSSNKRRIDNYQSSAMSDADALEYAMSLSLKENNRNNKINDQEKQNETEDEIMARVLAQSELEYQQNKERQQESDQNNKESCLIS